MRGCPARTLPPTCWGVVDANIALALVLPLPYSGRASQLWRQWESRDEVIFAPGLWGYEVISALRKAEVLHQMLRSDVDDALKVILALYVDWVHLLVE